jgi:YfiH family protein
MSVAILRSRLIPDDVFVHGFPERHGGVSVGKRASLNVGFRWGDDAAAVDENRRRVAIAAGYDPAALVVTKHVHGVEVCRVGAGGVAAGSAPAEFDGVVSDARGPVLAAFAADCVPLLFADPHARVFGAAHAGWRGTVHGMAPAMVRELAALGAGAERLRVALGPSIGPCCFEVGDEVVAEFRAALGEVPGLVVAGPHKPHIDLRVANRRLLERAGVRPEHIDDTPPCTRCNPDRFFSYRRDGLEGGVHMGFIGLR